MADEREHLPFGGSNAHRWLRCAGSVKLCASVPPGPSSEHARRGTHAHALLELALRERRDSVAEFEDQVLLPGYEPFDSEDIDAVQKAVDWISASIDSTPNAVLLIERKFKLHADTGGTADCVIYCPSSEVLRVVDYKHGAGKYVTEDAVQLKFYALCVAAKWEHPIRRVEATVIQPRIQHAEPIRTMIYGPADLLVLDDEIDEARAAALSDTPSFVPGTWCQWCDGAPACPALPRTVAKAAALWPEQADSVTITLPPAGSCRDPQKLAETLSLLPILQAFIDGIEDAALSMAMGGTKIPGMKLVEKVARRKWEDEQAARRWFAENTMLDEDDYAPRKLASVAQAEKLIKTDKEVVKKMAALVDKRSSGLKLVPETAKGDAVDPAAAMSSTVGAPVVLPKP